MVRKLGQLAPHLLEEIFQYCRCKEEIVFQWTVHGDSVSLRRLDRFTKFLVSGNILCSTIKIGYLELIMWAHKFGSRENIPDYLDFIQSPEDPEKISTGFNPSWIKNIPALTYAFINGDLHIIDWYKRNNQYTWLSGEGWKEYESLFLPIIRGNVSQFIGPMGSVELNQDEEYLAYILHQTNYAICYYGNPKNLLLDHQLIWIDSTANYLEYCLFWSIKGRNKIMWEQTELKEYIADKELHVMKNLVKILVKEGNYSDYVYAYENGLVFDTILTEDMFVRK